MKNDNSASQDDKGKAKSGKEINLHEGHRDRLRNRYVHYGLGSFTGHEALELLLFFAVPRRSTNELAHKMINAFGSFNALMEAAPQDVARRCNVSLNTAILISLISPMYKKSMESKYREQPILDNSERSGEYAKILFTGESAECFYLICLDSQRRLIYSELIARGTTTEAHVYPREIVKAALKHNAASVILAHNHPGRSLIPTADDLDATIAIREALMPVDVDVVDHIIVGGDAFFSFSEKKLLHVSY